MAETTQAQKSKTDRLREILGELEAEENDFSPLRAMALFRAWEDKTKKKDMADVISSSTLEELRSLSQFVGSGDDTAMRIHFDNLAFLVTFEDPDVRRRFIEG